LRYEASQFTLCDATPCLRSGNTLALVLNPQGTIMQLKRAWAEMFLQACTEMHSAKRTSFADEHAIYLLIPEGRCWIVRTGYVKLLDSGTDGERFIRLILGRGGLFGDYPYSATAFGGFTVPQHEQAITHGRTELLELDRVDLEKAAKTRSEFATMLLESATTHAQFLERRIRWQFVSPVRKRVATILRDLICFEGQRCKHGHTIDVRLTHQDLAELVVAARPVVSAELSQLREEGVISYTRSHFCVDNLDRIKRIAGDQNS
jgi:CRP/FNR family cyclic AMP-dependent transcriptional regulator